jgi:hypothetical protein
MVDEQTAPEWVRELAESHGTDVSDWHFDGVGWYLRDGEYAKAVEAQSR